MTVGVVGVCRRAARTSGAALSQPAVEAPERWTHIPRPPLADKPRKLLQLPRAPPDRYFSIGFDRAVRAPFEASARSSCLAHRLFNPHRRTGPPFVRPLPVVLSPHTCPAPPCPAGALATSFVPARVQRSSI